MNMFEYNICNQADRNIFVKQCKALERRIPGIKKGDILKDVDGSEMQIYSLNGKKITVYNSIYIDAVFVKSETELEQYFD